MTDLQDALDAAATQASIGEIWVAAGIYHPDRGTGNRQASFIMRSGLMVLGGFAGHESSRRDRNWDLNSTILSGDLGSARSYHVVTAYGVDSNALLDGFIIEGGKADGSGAAGEGGGIRGEEAALQISHCIIRGNTAGEGGGAYFYLSEPVFFNCRIQGNFATGSTGGLDFRGGFNSPAVHPRVINCTITGNKAVERSASAGISSTLLSGHVALLNSVLRFNGFTAPTYYPVQYWGAIQVGYSVAAPDGADPGLVNAAGPDGIHGTADDDVRLLPTSRCIDAGDSGAVPADRFDLDDDGNVTEPIPTDGAGWKRFYDDPNTPDTGAGAAPMVDIGALEGPVLQALPAAPALQVLEGSSAPLQVALSRRPDGSVAVTISVEGDEDLDASPATLTFDENNWQTAQVVTVTAAEDPDAFEGTAVLHLEIAGGRRVGVDLQEIENDSPPGTIYVNAAASGAGTGGTWEDAFPSLQAALNYASTPGSTVEQIWVAQGAYLPASSFQMRSGLHLYGGFEGGETSLSQRDWEQNATILTGDFNGDDGPGFTNYSDNRVHVVTAINVDDTARLDGFVIRSGSAVLQNPSSGGFGGGMFMENSQLVIANCLLTENQARQRGGGASATFGAAGGPTFINCVFRRNRAFEGPTGSSGYGGGLYAEWFVAPGVLNLVDCRFEENTALQQGGGMWVHCGITNVERCTFDANIILHGTGAGAGAYLQFLPGTEANFTQGAFTGHTVGDRGAGVFLYGPGTARFAGTSFTGNTARFGALCSDDTGMHVELDGVTFAQNHATTGAGALSVNGTMEVTGCTFAHNSAAVHGGVGSLRGSITDCIFVENSAGGSVGAISVSANSIVRNCTFIGNTAAESASGHSSSHYSGGGAVFANGARFYDCTFRDNHATGEFSAGGAINADQALSLVRCTFSGNSAGTQGGAVMAYSAAVPTTNVRLHNCTFTGNYAGLYGGGFAGNGELANCSFTGNVAADRGGAVAVGYRPTHLRNCSLYGNQASNAGGVWGLADSFSLRNTILWANTGGAPGSQAAQVGRASGVAWHSEYSCIQGWTGSIPGAGNVSSDPLFFDPDGPDDELGTEDDTLVLWQGSSCIDAGSNAEIALDFFDLDLNGNFTEPLPIDLGFLPRRMDDEPTPDTGSGSPPIVDIGAHEFLRQELLFQPCYANCDGSIATPILNTADFACFLQRFAAADPWANCDGSTVAPILNIADFSCFLQKFAAGCP